jgi:hypothetical protein
MPVLHSTQCQCHMRVTIIPEQGVLHCIHCSISKWCVKNKNTYLYHSALIDFRCFPDCRIIIHIRWWWCCLWLLLLLLLQLYISVSFITNQ